MTKCSVREAETCLAAATAEQNHQSCHLYEKMLIIC